MFIRELAERCVGYCGADIKALCTEAALFALRRRYPQIYTTNDKLQLDVNSINVNAKDFHHGMQNIVPTAQRSMVSPGRALSPVIEPLMRSSFKSAIDVLGRIFPTVLIQLASLEADTNCDKEAVLEDFCSDDDDEAPSIFENPRSRNKRTHSDLPAGPFLNFQSASYNRPATHRPRLLLSGERGQGQSSHLAPAILHHLEQLPVHVLDLPSLYAVSAKTPEESCAQIFREARRTSPSIIYMPHIGHWWDVCSDTLRATFLTLLQDMEPSTPVLLLATSDSSYMDLPEKIGSLFDRSSGNVMSMSNPSSRARREFFEDLFVNQATKPPSKKKKAAALALEVLPKAPPPEPRKLTEEESKRLYEQEEVTLRELRLFLRDVINRLARDRKFVIFSKPVDVEEVEDYYEIIRTPMDLSQMMSKIDLHKYEKASEFLSDIDLICSNALEYNPDTNPSDRAIRHRACALKDLAHSIVRTELDPEFDKQCEEIVASRRRRGETPSKNIPSYYHVKPLKSNAVQALPFSSTPSLPEDYPSRFSRRLRGMTSEDIPENTRNTTTQEENATTKEKSNISDDVSLDGSGVQRHSSSRVRIKKVSRRRYDDIKRNKRNRSPWCRPRRVKYRVHYVIDESESDEEQDQQINHCEDDGLKDEKELSPIDEKAEDRQGAVSIPDRHRLVHSPGASKPNSPLSPGTRLAFRAGSPRSVRPQSPGSARSLSPGSAHQQPSHRELANSGTELELISEHSYSKSPERSPTFDHSCHEPLTVETDYVNVNKNMPLLVNEDSNKENDPMSAPVSPRVSESGDARVTSSRKRKRSESQNSKSEHDVEMVTPRVGHSPSACQGVENHVSDKEEEASPAIRLTRSRTQNLQAAKAIQILEEPTPPLIVDKDALINLLDKAVEITKDFNVEMLEHIHCLLAQSVYRNRHNYDKTQLVEDMRVTLLGCTR